MDDDTNAALSRGWSKLDAGLPESSIWVEPHDVLRVWIWLMCRSNPYGQVRATLPAMALQCQIPLERTRQIVAYLEGPDSDSRTKTDEGRRLRPIDGGWMLINYPKYRGLLFAKPASNAQRQARYKARHKGNAVTAPVTASNAVTPCNGTEAEAEAEAEIRIEKETPPPPKGGGDVAGAGEPLQLAIAAPALAYRPAPSKADLARAEAERVARGVIAKLNAEGGRAFEWETSVGLVEKLLKLGYTERQMRAVIWHSVRERDAGRLDPVYVRPATLLKVGARSDRSFAVRWAEAKEAWRSAGGDPAELEG